MGEAEGRGGVAVFIDAEAVGGWLPRGARAVVERAAALGPVVVRRAYGDWHGPILGGAFRTLGPLGFECLQVDAGSAVHLAMGVVEVCDRWADVAWVVLVGRLAELVPVCRRLRSIGKRVDAWSGRGAASEAGRADCDRFTVLSVVAPPNDNDDLGGRVEAQRRLADRWDAEACLARVMGSAAGRELTLEILEDRVRRLDPGFEPAAVGRDSFRAFVRDAGLSLELARGPDDAWSVAAVEGDRASAGRAGPDTDSYGRLLRQHGPGYVAPQIIMRVYDTLSAQQAPPAHLMGLARVLGEALSTTEMERSLEWLRRAGVTDPQGLGLVAWPDRAELAQRLDETIGAAVAEACASKGVELEAEHLAPLLVGALTPDPANGSNPSPPIVPLEPGAQPLRPPVAQISERSDHEAGEPTPSAPVPDDRPAEGTQTPVEESAVENAPASADAPPQAQAVADADADAGAAFDPSSAGALVTRSLDELEARVIPLGRLREKMVEMDAAFDERSMGYEDFKSFVDSVGLDLSIEQSGDGHGWVIDRVPPPSASEVSAAEPLDAPDSALVEGYQSALKRKGWPVGGPGQAIETYRELAKADIETPFSLAVAARAARSGLGRAMSATDIRRALGVLVKAKVLTWVDSTEDGVARWVLSNEMGVGAVCDQVDSATVAQLMAVAGEAGQPFSLGAAGAFMTGPADGERVRRIGQLAERLFE